MRSSLRYRSSGTVFTANGITPSFPAAQESSQVILAQILSYRPVVGELDAARMINLQSLIDEAKCCETVRQLRWPEGVRCPHCTSAQVTKQGRDTTQPARQKYRCTTC